MWWREDVAKGDFISFGLDAILLGSNGDESYQVIHLFRVVGFSRV